MEEATKPAGFARWEKRSIPTKRLMAQTRPGWAGRVERILSNPGFGRYQEAMAEADAGGGPLIIVADSGDDAIPTILVGSEYVVAAHSLDKKRVSVLMVDNCDADLVQGYVERQRRPPRDFHYLPSMDEDEPAYLSR
ncbi:MAG: hypothetical protein AB7P02_12660 [Alphaproteobacteria bacterium]